MRVVSAAPVIDELRGLVLKTSGLVDVIRAALAPLAAQIDSAFVFGSVAKSKDTATSDIDLMVISETLAYGDLFTANKGDPRYDVTPRRALFAEQGTELKISPLLEGIRTLSGEKIQWYLASELRDRIRDAQVRVTVIDRPARKQYEAEPR